MESEEDPDESFNFIATLFDRLLADVSSKKKPKPPKSFLDENTYMLCKVVDYELGESALTNALEGDDLEHLRLLPQLFDNYLRIHPGTLPTEVIIWTISKILLMLSSPMLYDRLGGLYQEHLIALCQYLSAEAKNFLLKQTIVALCEITKGSENVCLKACEGGNEAAGEVKCPKGSIKLVPVTIAISELNENRSLLQNCLLDLIQHGGFDLNYLDECHLLQVAWRALLPLIETSAPTLKNKCILAVQRLVSLDLCNRFMAEALLRRLMAIENRLIEVIDADEDVVRLEESLATCQQTFASCLRKFATLRTFEDLGLENLIEWAVLLLEICRKQPLPKERLINFLAALCSILSRLNGVDEGFLDGIAQLANDITLIVQTLVVRNVVISVGQLADLFSFIFTVDKWTSSGVSGQEVVRIVCNAKEKFVGTEVVKAIRVQQLIISAVKRAKNGEAVLLQIIPHSDELLQVLKTVSTMESDGDEVLLSLIELISTLIDCAEQEQINWIALLSLPWLTEPIDCSRHKRSIPLLAEIRRLVAASAKSCTVEVKRSTISAIARMQCTSEWRRIIFTYALESLDVKLQRAALEHFANFVHSTDIYAFNILLDKILFLATSAIRRDGGAEICATVLKAVAISLCTVDTKKMLAEGEVCSVCSQEVVTTQKMKMDPSKLLYLFETVACYEDKELRLAYCAALQSTLKHVQFHSKDTLESAVQKSLVLMGDLDEDVRADYELCFKQIIHMQWNKLYSDIGIKLSDLEVEGKQIAHLQYTLTCAQHAADADLANNCFVKIILLAVHSSSPNAISAARKLIQSELAKSEPTITPQQLFLRKKAQICKYLARNLVTITYNNGSVQRDEVHLDGDVVKRLKDEAQEAFAVMAELFGYQREDGWLSDASGELVPSVILAKGAFPEAIVGVLEKVLEMRRLRASALISECFPSLLIHLISSKSSSEIIRKTFRFIEHFTQGECTWLDLMSSKVYGCTVIVLQHLSMNENLCMDNLKRLHRIANGEDAPFVFTNFIEQRYLGVLLHFRPAFTDDHFYSERALIASSLCCMMRKIYEEGTNFLDTTATKMLAVLRVLTPLGELSIEPWKTFVETLSDEALLGLLPQILVSIAPLLKFNEARSILSFIFTTKRLQLSSNLEFERISLMLWNNPKVHINEFLSSEHKSAPLSKVLGACASLLKESNEEVSELVLHKVFSVLEGTCWDDDRSFDNIAAQLVPSLLHTIRNSVSAECRRLACLVFGRLGAIDPGRIGLSSSNSALQIDRRSAEIVFVDGRDPFYVEVLERAATAFSGILDASAQELCSYSIQMVLRELVGRNSENGEAIWNSLSERCRKEVHMLRSSSFTRKGPPNELPSQRPLMNVATDCMSWMSLWYLTSTRKIRDARLKKLFDSLSGVVESDAVFARFILPQLMLQGIVEHNLQVIAECEAEMRAVLQRALLEDGWPRLAAHVIFSITDCLERYAISRSINRIPTDMVLKRTRELLTRVLNERLPDGTLLAVTAAERCHCPARALRWCEQYAINQDGTGRNVFDKSQYYSLQRIYSQLDDLDGILGAFETIKLNSTPTTNECILAFEANGDYSEALPLYQQSREQKIPLIKCMLRLNQPFVALSTAEAMLQAEEDPAILEGIRAAQMEAAWHLHEWSLLDKLVDKYATTSSWGATNASILCSLKHKDEVSMNTRIEGARARLVDSLTAMTIEDSDTYAQAYKYITQLHILDEIEEAKDVLCSFKGEQLTSERLIAVLSKWQKRSACVMQCTGVLEPVFTVRRELLRLTESNLAQTPICELLLHSCRMSRLAGHLQIAWAYLVEAKALNVNQFEVAMEEARFLFEKGNQTQAIGILSNLLDERFSRKVQQLQHVIDEQKKNVNISFAGLREVLRDEPKEEKDNFVKVQLLLADYSLRAGACSFSDLYSKYNALPYVADPSEDLYYRVAIFLDNYLYSKNENLLADKVSLILQAYIRVLTQGRTHLFHVMPRMLTIWLDNAQKREEESSVTTKKPLNLGLPSASRTISNNEKEIGEMNSLMRGAFSRLDHYMFYTAFAQLISRIIHPNEDVFDTLKNILAELLVEYPHQCLWQSIAVYRSDQKKQELRFSRCRTVYEIAKRKDRSGQLKTLIAQYEYAAAAFIKVAEDSYPTGTHSSFSQKYAFLANFFKTGIMDQCVKISSKCESTVSRPLVVVPLREMIEHALPVPIPNSLSQYPVGETPTEKQDTDIGDPSFSNIYIDSIEEQFIVMRSMVRPKKITLVASDGKRYSLMCKAKDELRKDCRLMDINRMVNALLHQNADSRRRQLSVRTYNVVPLQDAGGLIEWIPNLQTYRGVLEPLMTEKCSNVMSDKEWFSNWIPHGTDEQKYERLVTEYFSRHPVVMAEWFRRNFPDPCKWYAARLAFTHTSAVMSMVGFVLGLGDRHGENLLIDVTNGDAIHVDFNLLFNKGELLAVPEVVPFRLTRNIVNGFGVTGVEGAFRRSCESTMRVLRENEAVLLTVLQTFVHDPLLEWVHSEVRAQQLKQRQGGHGVGLKPCSSMAQQQAQEAIEMIRSRLRGNIVSPIIYRNTFDSLPMSVEGQVGKLIQLASDERVLAKMYIGWCPFL